MTAAFGIAGKISTGIGTDWVRQSSTPGTESQRASVLNGSGNEAASQLYDERDTVTEVWKAKGISSLTIPDLGAVVDTYLLTSIKLDSSNTDYATLTITAHKHTDGTPAMTAATGFAALVTAAYGALRFSGGTGTLNSSSIEATCQHAEAKDDQGDNIAGENYNAMLTVNETFIDGGALGAGWDETSESNSETNTGYRTKTLTGTKTLALS